MEKVEKFGLGHFRNSKGETHTAKQKFALWFRGKATKEASGGVQMNEPKIGVEFLGPNS